MAHENAIHPAFPIVNPETGTLYDGLTKREYFVGLALQGKLSGGQYHDHKEFEAFAKSCVEYADALLLELEK